MKIAIVGYGFVGKALEAGFYSTASIIKIDPKLKTKISDLASFNPDAIFICVPTPMNKDFSQDISILHKVIDEIKSLNLKSYIVIKSTVLPTYIQLIESLIPSFIYNPEFLREKHAIEDFINSKLIVFGGNKQIAKEIGQIYKNHTKCVCKDYIYTDAIAASLIKYSINSFLATKVSFFNELHQLFLHSDTLEDWNTFIDTLSKDNRIGPSHMQVPGHDGRLGFGGACLPKDSTAFLKYASSKDIELNVLKSAINSNNAIRASYNSKTEREKEQNIQFKGENKL